MAKPQDNALSLIVIKSVSPSLKKELSSIAKYEGLPLGTWLKPKLREIASSYPIAVRQYNDE